MTKSPDAFRTISEVAAWLDVPAHVLRFWESRFTQIKPLKRAGGRRYYRPTDIELLGGIKRLLHDDGVTIRGVQKILREEGVRHVAALCPAERADAELTEKAGTDDLFTLDRLDRVPPAPHIEGVDETGAAPPPPEAPAPVGTAADSDDPGERPDMTDASDLALGLVTPKPPVLATFLRLDRSSFARAGVDPAVVLGRAQALAEAMDGRG